MGEAKKNWFARHKVLTVVLALVALVIVGSALGSNNSNTTVNNTANSSTNKSANNTSANQASAQTPAKLGDTLTVNGSKGLAVTLLQVIDPAQGSDEFNTPDAGKRFVAVEVKILNNGTAAYNDDANSNVTLIGSDNQSYTADFDTVSECTNFNDGSYTLAAGETATGCVVFQVPDGVTGGKVQFQVENGLSTNTAEWTL